MKAPLPPKEKERLETLWALEILDTAAEISFDDITILATEICGTPISMVSLIDENRQWIKSKVGIETNELPREHSFCGHAILDEKVLEIPDSLLDPRFSNNPFVVSAPFIRFYAGAPLTMSNGQRLGTLCVVSPEPKTLSPDQRRNLELLARHTVHLIEARHTTTKNKKLNVHLDSLFQNMTEGMLLCHRTGYIEDFNSAALEILDITETEMTSMTNDKIWQKFETQQDDKSVNSLLQKVFETGQPFKKMESKWLTTKSVPRLLQMSLIPLFKDDSSKPTHVLITFSDISEQVHLKNDLKTAHDELKVLVNTMTEGLFALDETGIITEVNKSALDLLGLTEDEFVGINYHSFKWNIIGEDEKPFAKGTTPIRLVQTECKPQHGVIVGITNSRDEFFWISVDAVPIFKTGSKRPGVLVTFLNVTERIRLQKEFQNELSLRREILDSATYLVIATDSKGLITQFNATAERTLGYKAQEVVGVKSPGIFHDPFEMAVRADELATQLNISVDANFEVFSLNAQVYGRYEREWTFTRKDGTQFPGFLSVTTLRNARGEITGYLGISHDLTEEKKMKENLERQRLSMASTSKMAALGEMAGGIAHEINNPLTIIYGKADHLYRQIERDAFSKERILDDIQKIKLTSERIAKIVKGLRTFSRSGENDPFQCISIETVITETLAFCSERFKNQNVILEVSPMPGLDVECRSTQLSQVILNLLNNAFDAVQLLPEKWVRLVVEATADAQVQISVTDSGGGIPPFVLDKLMQPFFTTKEVGKGTGLGLSVSQGIIQDHFGTLEVDRSCKNTRFVITLPLSHKQTQQAA